MINMQTRDAASAFRAYELQQIFEPAVSTGFQRILQSETFSRIRRDLHDQGTLIQDRFPDSNGVSCCFLRLAGSDASTALFSVKGEYRLVSCPSGGWLVKTADTTLPSYWIPQAPVMRVLDSSGRILSENSTAIVGIKATPGELAVEIQTSGKMLLDLTLWRFPSGETGILAELEQPLVLEKQPVFLWTSQTTYRSPADLYLYLVHGHVYTNRFIWPRKWKICSELDAYGLYTVFRGLELATNKTLYGLFKRQLLYSVIARQSGDGGWYHGEWTDLVESHYRFHNGAIHLLEAALEEDPDEKVRAALEHATAFISQHTDKTSLGVWFLHDSLEESVDGMNELWEQTGAKWIPSHTLGKSQTNKLILNTHLDSTIALQRYQEITGDDHYAEVIASANSATRSLLRLHPAERLYCLMYWAIGLTLLPLSEARSLALPVRAIKRLASKFLIQLLPRIKRMFPRFVMPGGLIERHLSPLHFNIQYHAVNTMDLARLLRCFPDESLREFLNNAVKFVANNNILQYWSESKPRQYALVVWVDALYRLCIMTEQVKYRHRLATAVMFADDTGLGLPPAILGSESETVRNSEQMPCPSPVDSRLRVVNLCHGARKELLVVNTTHQAVELTWEADYDNRLSWETDSGRTVSLDGAPLHVPPRSWLRGL